jgi:arylformamidase
MTSERLDRAALDAEYNLRARVPEFQDYFDRYDRMSDALRASGRGRLDLAYGPSPRQAIDLFLPEAKDPPLLVFIHGGYWQSQDRKRFAFVAAPLLEAGAATALLGYDLAPEVDMDAIVAQVRRGLAWLYRHGAELGCDAEHLVVSGHSAGGHLAAMALATDWSAEAGLPEGLIKGLCPISGVFDLEPISRCYLNEVLRLTPDQARRHSPLRLPPRGSCPVTVTVGAKETAAFLEQSRQYAAHLEAAGQSVELVIQPGLDHFGIVEAMAQPDGATVRTLRRQLGV